MVLTHREYGPLRGKDDISVQVGLVFCRSKLTRHVRRAITDSSFSFERDRERIAEKARMHESYVIRTSVAVEETAAAAVF